MKDKKIIKCLVWDLDKTLWDGVLSEGTVNEVKKGVLSIIQELDQRGILQSIASKNNFSDAMEKLKKFGIDQYFLYPQIGWQPKSESIKKIAELINIHLESVAFIDDQEFERDEVSYSLQDVLCLDADSIDNLLEMSAFNPTFVTSDSKLRRKTYQDDILRKEDEAKFTGTKDEFLKTLQMRLVISVAKESDLQRIEELTLRTNQLNSTGVTYSYSDLMRLISTEDYTIYIAELDDKYGTYGKIGVMIVKKNLNVWKLKLILTSCRVLSRGVGTIMLNYLIKMAIKEGVTLLAEFLPTERNKMMYIAYKFTGFEEYSQQNKLMILKHNCKNIQQFPHYMNVVYNENLT